MKSRALPRRQAWMLFALVVLMSLLLGIRPEPVRAAVLTQTDGGPQVIRVGIYILNIGNLDISSGTYWIDFYLQFECDQPCDPTNFDIMNAISFESEDQTGDHRGGRFHTYRVKAELSTNLNLADYPFDEHLLTIILEDKNLNTGSLLYEYDPSLSGIDSGARAAGWDIRPEIDGEVSEHPYEVFDGAWSRFTFHVHIYHPLFPSFMKGLFAAIVIVAVGMLSFLMTYDDTEDRIALTSGTLASAIFYHMTLTASIPPVGYLTYADKFMMLQYVFITLALAVSITLFLLVGTTRKARNMHALAKKVHKATRWTIPLAWVMAMIVLHLVSFSG